MVVTDGEDGFGFPTRRASDLSAREPRGLDAATQKARSC